MSAIFGVITSDRDSIKDNAHNLILQTLAHRGLDGNDVWKGANGVLGACRINSYSQQLNDILPLVSHGHVLTADARIDNREQLFGLLGVKQEERKNTPDSVLILLSYLKWDRKCLDFLEGEFVFAIWNELRQSLFIGRDAIGMRPLFYCNEPGQFSFCSEIKGVLAAKKYPPEFNPAHLIEYHFRRNDPLQTYVKHIFAVLPGSSLTWNEGRICVERYWIPNPRNKYSFKKKEDWYACARELFIKSIERNLNDQVPVGVTLSGGLDSTAVACVLSQLLMKKNKHFYAFSSVLKLNHVGIEKDERNYIEIVKKRCPNLLQVYVEPTEHDYFEGLQQAFEQDETFPNVFFNVDTALLKAASVRGVKNLFTGYGGDFWLSWTGSSALYELWCRGKLRDLYRKLEESRTISGNTILKEFNTKVLSYSPLVSIYSKLFKKNYENWQTNTFLKKELISRYYKESGIGPEKHFDFMMHYIRSGRMGSVAGMLANRNEYYGMRSSVPAFDKNMIEFLMDVPLQMFFDGGRKRSFFRNVMQGIVPDEILGRTDKLPYAPGYQKRVINARLFFENLVNQQQYSWVWEKYLDKESLMHYFETIAVSSEFTPSHKIVAIRVAQAAIAAFILAHLNSKKFFKSDNFI